jgi:hypothetical protein
VDDIIRRENQKLSATHVLLAHKKKQEDKVSSSKKRRVFLFLLSLPISNILSLSNSEMKAERRPKHTRNPRY